MNITIIGTGYVGLVTGTCLAETGFHVTCIDHDSKKITGLKKGVIPIYEPGLEELVTRNAAEGRLSFTTSYAQAIGASDIVFIAVGTPPCPKTGEADLRYVDAAAREIAGHLEGYTVVVTKSTVPVRTGARVEQQIRMENPHAIFDVASNPEFLREGSAISDFMQPDRIVVGANSHKARQHMATLYDYFEKKGVPVLFTGLETAELSKYAANAFLATKIAFINEIADLCECTGANVREIADVMGLDARIGRPFLNAGPGFGGSCFPKDTLALAQIGTRNRTPMHLVETVISSNNARKARMAEKIRLACGGDIGGHTLAVLGLTFKADTDDMRDSPSLDVIPVLLEQNARLRLYDPEGMDEARKHFSSKKIHWCNSALDAAEGADALVILTEWAEFGALDLPVFKEKLNTPLLIDLRNLYQRRDVEKAGFRYVCVGDGGH